MCSEAVPWRFLPDKAIDLMDQASVRVRLRSPPRGTPSRSTRRTRPKPSSTSRSPTPAGPPTCQASAKARSAVAPVHNRWRCRRSSRW
ncbi:hypothetical protein ACFXJ8_05290 [Nonomuraea sp. NPDC059194]|uniref:hypothetical protein n=1 Tax=Nonomuraea sp. NPDC059194 TaxID=3346764 RepID=UPI0036761008